jgi:UDPglucose--hexose-1-phosphate uridylyltransferase
VTPFAAPAVPAGPHRRYNPLLDEWVLCSPHRLTRPWQGQTEAGEEYERPAFDPTCYLCPGNPRAKGKRNPEYSGTFAFDNDFPALLPEAPSAPAADPIDPLLGAMAEHGRCRVLCFSPRHDLTLGDMDVAAIRGVVDAWVDETRALGQDPRLAWVQVFENKGAMMGCSNPHPHGQIWATAHLPAIPSRKHDAQRRYHERHGRDLLGDYLERELRLGERVVCANAHWVWLVPFWAVWPFETLLVPRRAVTDLPSLATEEKDALADILKRLNVRYDHLFDVSFPYSMGWHGRPLDGGAHPGWRLHASWFPPLLRSATVRKFLVGYEMTGEPQRDLTAEAAAARLREMPEEGAR